MLSAHPLKAMSPRDDSPHTATPGEWKQTFARMATYSDGRFDSIDWFEGVLLFQKEVQFSGRQGVSRLCEMTSTTE